MVAAATEYDYYRKDNYPSAIVVVKNVAKTVVIHYVILQSLFERWLNTIL